MTKGFLMTVPHDWYSAGEHFNASYFSLVQLDFSSANICSVFCKEQN